jgi:protein TonB
MSMDNNANKQKSSLLWLWLAAAAVAVVVVLALGIFILIPLFYPAQPPQDKIAQILTEPPPPPPPPPVSSSPQAPAKIISGHPASQSTAHPKRVVLSSAVAASLLIQKSVPRYPPIAKAARVSGTVVLHAGISTSGSVINLQAVSGPAMLQQSALDAVRTWKYRPYLLNNQPVEFETTVNVVYTLGD